MFARGRLKESVMEFRRRVNRRTKSESGMLKESA